MANELGSGFNKAVFVIHSEEGSGYFGFYNVDADGRPVRPRLPYHTVRKVTPGFDAPKKLEQLTGAVEIMRDWIGYEPTTK